MNKSLIVGIYGISGCGKSHTLAKLAELHPEWLCVEGSHVIETVLKQDNAENSMTTFYSMNPEEKTALRERAAEWIRNASQGCVTIVAGHFSFPHNWWFQGEMTFDDVFSKSDGITYHAILYLKKDANIVYAQREKDSSSGIRERMRLSHDQLQCWIDHEETKLREKCKSFNIAFTVCSDYTDPFVLNDFIQESLIPPMVQEAKEKSSSALKSMIRTFPQADTYLLIDGDRTIWNGDTGKLFLGDLANHQKAIFQRYPSYTFRAFWESAMLLTSKSDNYHQRCKTLANELDLYQSWVDFLLDLPHGVHPVLVTSGVREIWIGALEKAGLLHSMSVVAGNHLILHTYIVDAESKGMVATELRAVNPGCHVLSFGDSEIDVPMMKVADQKYLVLDSRHNRSVQEWILQEGHHSDSFFQISPSSDYMDFHHGIRVATFKDLALNLKNGINATREYSSKSRSLQILAGQSRRADLQGPDLQELHRQMGKRLAESLIDDYGLSMGLVARQSYSHVQGSSFDAFVPASRGIIILPLMRGGEPMSRGVFETFPEAQLVHYHDGVPDLKSVVRGEGDAKTILVVDSVINRGHSVRKVLRDILGATPLQVFVLSAVTQCGAARDLPREFPRVRFLTVRISENKYTGKGGTDTGNRLFGTA